MNVFEFSEKYKISVAKSRKIAKDYPAIFEGEENPIASEIRHYLGRGQPLTAAHLVALVENPSIVMALGRYADRAQTQADELGNPKNEIAPKIIVATISDAAKGEPESVERLLDWLETIIPAKPVMHSYIAVRLLLGVPENLRKYEVPRIPRALLNCRRHARFANWWSVQQIAGRSVTNYRRPKNPLANLDL